MAGIFKNEEQAVAADILLLLRFFDEKCTGSAGHATAVVAVAGEDLGLGLLRHCLEHTRGAKVKQLEGTPTTGSRRGPRLDRWIEVEWKDGTATLFQAEVKNWSAHSYHGEVLPVAASTEDVLRFTREEWGTVRRRFKEPKDPLTKVLKPMKPPQGYGQAQLRPLLIYWAALHKEDNIPTAHGCFFDYTLGDAELPDGWEKRFDTLAVFCMSLYLRALLSEGTKTIEIFMPDATRRMAWLRNLFKETGGVA